MKNNVVRYVHNISYEASFSKSTKFTILGLFYRIEFLSLTMRDMRLIFLLTFCGVFVKNTEGVI
jgi:uncharacterized membrane protein